MEEYIIKKSNELYTRRVRRKVNKSHIKCIEYFSNGKNYCDCCGEKNILFLTLSHPNGDGWIDRILKGSDISKYLVKNNFETNFTIIIECYNCNLGRERNNGVCPHNV